MRAYSPRTEQERAVTGGVVIRSLDAEQAEAAVSALSEVLIDCVENGASVSFMAPLGREKADAFWRGVAAGVAAGERVLLVATDAASGEIVGTVQLVTAQPDNQPHRADVAKMLVRHAARRRGIGGALMGGVEERARECGKSLLVLDTASPDAERLYERSGWVRVGVVPGYALLPDGRPCDTAYYYKRIA
jgi:GNAT superfamily N-acetyltransferase